MPERTIVLLLILSIFGAFAQAEEERDLRDTVREQANEILKLKREVVNLRGQEATRIEQDITAYLETTSRELDSDQPAFGGRVRLGGYFSLEFRDDGEGSTMEFDQHRLVLKLQAEVAKNIGFETEIEIEGGGADASFLDDNEILVEYAELSFELVEDLVTFAVGAILVPWGRFNGFHDDPLNDLTDRPLPARRLGAVAFDQAGIAVEGTLQLTESGFFLDYDVALVQGFDEGISTNGGIRGARQSFRSDNNENKQVFYRLVLTIPVRFLDILEIGTSGTYGKYDDLGHNDVYGYALEVFFKRGPVEFVAEYMNLRFERDPTAPASDPRRADGWMIEVAFHFFPDGWRGKHGLFTDESTFTFVVRVEGLDLNHSTDGSTFRDDLVQVTVGFNFRPVERTVIKISYTFVDSDMAGFGSGSADRFAISWATYF